MAIVTNGSNGHGSNGHSTIAVNPALGFDAGEDRDKREPKPCLARMENGGWCQKPDGHDRQRDAAGNLIVDAHDGPARPHGPEQSQWDVHRGQKRMCGAVTGPATLCGFERGHGGRHEDP